MKEITSSKFTVSVVIPVLNEERFIEQCIESLMKQTFPTRKIEVLVVDGGSIDRTKSIVKSYIEKFPGNLILLSNPRKTQACAMNIGIKAASGRYIIRIDAHAEYSSNYIEECVKLLDTGRYDNVGGVAETKGRTPFGKSVARMMSSKFGVGNSVFRTGGTSGEVDTVPFGAFRRELFENIGGFDERLGRNEDNEINYRIKENGGIVYLSNTIKFTYFCRDTLKGILSMAFQNGKWTIIASKLRPGSMKLRHFIPYAFVLSLIVGVPLSVVSPLIRNFFFLEIFLYIALDIFFSIQCAHGLKQAMTLICLFPAFHVAYGVGSFVGMVSNSN